VNGALNFVAAEARDHSLDLPPVAEARDIAVVSAPVGPGGGLEPGVIAVASDQVGSIRESHAAMDEGAVHGATIVAAAFRDCRQMSST